jgi:choline-glycine betaine transporter
MLNLCGIVVVILKMATTRNFSMLGIYSGPHNLPTYEMSLKSDNVELVRIVVAILKMVTARNFSMSGIYSGPHNLPTYEMPLKSVNVEFVLYCGSHFENGNQ